MQDQCQGSILNRSMTRERVSLVSSPMAAHSADAEPFVWVCGLVQPGAMGDIQVRAVDERWIAAVKERAEDEGKSLPAYLRELIERDVAVDESRHRMAVLLAEIEGDPDRPAVSRAETAEARLSGAHGVSA